MPEHFGARVFVVGVVGFFVVRMSNTSTFSLQSCRQHSSTSWPVRLFVCLSVLYASRSATFSTVAGCKSTDGIDVLIIKDEYTVVWYTQSLCYVRAHTGIMMELFVYSDLVRTGEAG